MKKLLTLISVAFSFAQLSAQYITQYNWQSGATMITSSGVWQDFYQPYSATLTWFSFFLKRVPGYTPSGSITVRLYNLNTSTEIANGTFSVDAINDHWIKKAIGVNLGAGINYRIKLEHNGSGIAWGFGGGNPYTGGGSSNTSDYDFAFAAFDNTLSQYSFTLPTFCKNLTSINLNDFISTKGTFYGDALSGDIGLSRVWNDYNSCTTYLNPSLFATGTHSISFYPSANNNYQRTVFTFNIDDPPFASITINNQPTCTTGGSLTASGSGGNGSYTYSWSNNQSGATISNLPAGSYTVTVTDGNGCTGTTTATINAPPGSPTASIPTIVQPTCTMGGSLTASGSGGNGSYTYSWSNNQSGATITNLPAGNYTVTVTDGNGCTGTATATINAPPGSPTASIPTIVQPTCTMGGSLTASGSGGNGSYTYSWSNNQSGATITNLPAGNYTVTVTDGNGCTGTATATINAPPGSPTASIPTIVQPTCTTLGSLTASGSGGNGSYTYSWSNNQSGATITNLPAGNYTVTVTDGNGCTGTATATINAQPPDNTITLTSAIGTSSQTICLGSPITNITYTTTGATGATFSGLPTGVIGNWSSNVVTISGTPNSNMGSPFSYTVTLTGGCGMITTTGTITVNPDNTINLTSAPSTIAQTVCINTPITNITYSTTGATGATFSLPSGVNGSWASNTVTISGTPTSATGSPFNYTVTLTGGCGIITATGTITVNPDNTINLTSAPSTTAQTVCINTPITNITYSTTGATGATFSLPSGVNGSWASNTVTISGTPTSATGSPFNYTVTLTGGCGMITTTGTIDVISLPSLFVLSGPPPVCTADNITFSLSGSQSGFTYNLLKNNVLAQSKTGTGSQLSFNINDVMLSDAGAYTIEAFSNTMPSCTTLMTGTVDLVVKQSPITPAIIDQYNPNQCATATGYITLGTYAPGTSYDVLYNGITKTITADALGRLKIDQLFAGSYTSFAIKASNNCTSQFNNETVSLFDPNAPAQPQISFEGDLELCEGDTLILTIDDVPIGAEIKWYGPNGEIPGATGQTYSITGNVQETGTYTATFTKSGCTGNSATGILVTVTPLPATPKIMADNTLSCEGDAVQIYITNSNQYGSDVTFTWLKDNGTYWGQYDAWANTSGSYSVTAMSGECVSMESAPVVINFTSLPNPFGIYGPNDTTICIGDMVQFTGTPTNGILTWYYIKNGNKIQIPNGKFTGIEVGNFTIEYEWFSPPFCYKTDTTHINVESCGLPTANAGNDTTVCHGTAPIPLKGTAENYNTILWEGPGIFSHKDALITDFTPTSPHGDSITLTLTASNTAGKKITDTITIFFDTIPLLTLQMHDRICIDSMPVQLHASPPGGTWSGGTYISNSGVFNQAGLTIGTYNVTYKFSNACGPTEKTFSVEVEDCSCTNTVDTVVLYRCFTNQSVTYHNKVIYADTTLRIKGMECDTLIPIDVKTLVDSITISAGLDSLWCDGRTSTLLKCEKVITDGAEVIVEWRKDDKSIGKTDTITVNRPGQYELNLSAKFNNMVCDTTLYLEIRVAQSTLKQPIALRSFSSLCVGSVDTIRIDNKDDFDDIVSFDWDIPNGCNAVFSSDTTEIYVSFATAASYILSCTPKDTCGLGPKTSIVIQVSTPPSSGLPTEDLTTCDDQVPLMANSSLNNIVWSGDGLDFSNTNTANTTISSTDRGKYSVYLAAGENYCRIYDTLQVHFIEKPIVSINPNLPRKACNKTGWAFPATIQLGDYLEVNYTGMTGVWKDESGNQITNTEVNFVGMDIKNYTYIFYPNVFDACNATADPVQMVIEVVDCDCPFLEVTATLEGVCADTSFVNLDDFKNNSVDGKWSSLDTNIHIVNNLVSFIYPGSYIFYYTIDKPSNTNCPFIDTLSITVKSPPSHLFTKSIEVCSENTDGITTKVTFSDISDVGDWSGIGSAPTIIGGEVDFSTNTPGHIFLYQRSIPPGSYCKAVIDTLTVTVKNCNCPQLSLNSTSYTLCGTDTTLNLMGFISQADDGKWYIDQTAAGIKVENNVATFNHPSIDAVSFSYKLTSPKSGCDSLQSLTIHIDHQSLALDDKNPTACLDEMPIDLSKILQVGNNGTYISENSAIDSRISGSSLSTTGLSPGTYPIFAITPSLYGHCISDTAVIALTLHPLPKVDAGQDQILDCHKTPVTIGTEAISGQSYSWSSGQHEAKIKVNEPNQYVLTTTDNTTLCDQKDTVSVSLTDDYIQIKDSVVTPQSCIDLKNGKIDVSFKGGHPPYNVKWTDMPDNLSAEELIAGDYKVEVTDQNGCISEFTFHVPFEADPDCKHINVDLITPNGDGINDVLFFDEVEDNPNEKNEIYIFTRWGQVVYHAQPYRNDWKGETQSGQRLPDGTYYYKILFNDKNNKHQWGYLTLVRGE